MAILATLAYHYLAINEHAAQNKTRQRRSKTPSLFQSLVSVIDLSY